MAFQWRAEVDADLAAELGLAQEFPTQADAEAWLSASFDDLTVEGVDAVTLVEGDRVVYGPMSLHA